MFENPRRGRQARNFITNVPKILVLKSSSEQIFSRKLPLGAPVFVISRLVLLPNCVRYIEDFVLSRFCLAGLCFSELLDD